MPLFVLWEKTLLINISAFICNDKSLFISKLVFGNVFVHFHR